MWALYSKVILQSSLSVTNTGHSADNEVEAYLQDPLLPPSTNIFAYWKNQHAFPRLRQLARKYLCVPPSTVESERLFSTAGLVVDKKRSRLDPERVRMLVFLNKNL